MLVFEGHICYSHADLGCLCCPQGHGNIQTQAAVEGHIWIHGLDAVGFVLFSMSHDTIGAIEIMYVERAMLIWNCPLLVLGKLSLYLKEMVPPFNRASIDELVLIALA